MSSLPPADLEPIESHVRDEPTPDVETIVIRGGPLSVAKLVDHARRQSRAFSYVGRAMYSVSADATVSGWTVEAILRERLWSRSTYAQCRVGVLQDAGFVLLPTHRAPHYDVLMPDDDPKSAASLLDVLGVAETNPYKRGRR